MKRNDRQSSKREGIGRVTGKHVNKNSSNDPEAKSDGKENTNRHVYLGSVVLLDVVKELKDEHNRERGEDSRHQKQQLNWTIIAASLVFLYTFAAFWQGCSNQQAARAAASSAATAHDTLILDERPWVGIGGSGHMNAEIVRGLPIKIHMDVQNFGKSPAFNETSVNKLTNHPIADPKPIFDDYSKKDAGPTITLMPGSIASVDLATDNPGKAGFPIIINDADLQFVNEGKVQLFVYGSIWYDDTFGKSHQTDYCLQFVPPIRTPMSFTACPTHNHAD
jgi:hypothetical protein